MIIWSEAPSPREQSQLMAPSLDEQIGADSGIRFLDWLLREVDWEPWESYYHQSGPGRPTHHPRLVCGAILYGLIRGMHSTRMLEYATQYCLDFRWMLDGRTIDHSTFAKFRTRHGDRIKALFREINRKAAKIKQLSLEEVIIDGTRIRADSDRHGARTAEALERRLAILEGKIAAAVEGLEKAQLEGRREEAEECLRKKKDLERSQHRDQQALFVARKRDAVKKAKEGANSADVRVPVTDPDAHLLPNKEGGYGPNYTPVIAVDSQTGLIVGEHISADNVETDNMVGLIEEARESIGANPKRVLADKGFASGHELETLKQKGIETYTPVQETGADNPALRECVDQAVPAADWDRLPYRGAKLSREAFIYEAGQDAYYCPMGHQMLPHRRQTRHSKDGRRVSLIEYTGAPCQGCPLAKRCLSGKAKSRMITRDQYETLREEIKARMNTARGQQIYTRRAPCVEGAFGTIKAAMGIRRFERRGLQKVRQDWTWTCLAFNIKKMMNWGPGQDDNPRRGPLSAYFTSLGGLLRFKTKLFLSIWVFSRNPAF